MLCTVKKVEKDTFTFRLCFHRLPCEFNSVLMFHARIDTFIFLPKKPIPIARFSVQPCRALVSLCVRYTLYDTVKWKNRLNPKYKGYTKIGKHQCYVRVIFHHVDVKKVFTVRRILSLFSNIPRAYKYITCNSPRYRSPSHHFVVLLHALTYMKFRFFYGGLNKYREL